MVYKPTRTTRPSLIAVLYWLFKKTSTYMQVEYMLSRHVTTPSLSVNVGNYTLDTVFMKPKHCSSSLNIVFIKYKCSVHDLNEMNALNMFMICLILCM